MTNSAHALVTVKGLPGVPDSPKKENSFLGESGIQGIKGCFFLSTEGHVLNTKDDHFCKDDRYFL